MENCEFNFTPDPFVHVITILANGGVDILLLYCLSSHTPVFFLFFVEIVVSVIIYSVKNLEAKA